MGILCKHGWVFALLGCAISLGCGQSEGAATVAVTGSVTQKGSPIEGAIVSFVPSGNEGQSAVGVTDSSGKYSLTTRKKDDGAIPGHYKVSITKYDGPKATTGGGDVAGPNGEMPASYTGEAPEAPPAKNLLPAKYASPDSSGFSAAVSAGAPNTHNFELEG